MNLKTVILEFLANEFKMQATDLTADLSLLADFGLSKIELTALLQRLQDSLGIILPEDAAETVNTVGDLTDLVAEDEP